MTERDDSSDGASAQLWRRGRWLRNLGHRPEIVLLLIGVLLPNLAFMALSLFGFSMPPRTVPLVAYLLVAASLRFLPPVVVLLLYLGAVLFDLVFCATQFFGLTLREAFFSLQFINELDILNAQLYAVLIGILFLTIASVGYLVLRHGRRAAHGSWLPMLLCGLVWVPADLVANTPRHSNFWLQLGRDVPFESASQRSGYQDLVASPSGRPMLVVIVEALGRFADPSHQKLLDDALATPSLLARYQVTNGRNSFIGSTTAGEMRELCGTRTSYLSVMDQDLRDCLPFKLREAGYETSAYHGFSESMFQRNRWWPHIGIEHSYFAGDLYRQGEPLCGDVFVGLCDPDLLPRIAETLRKDKPNFVYLLTLNTHIPVISDQAYGHLACGGDDRAAGPIADREVCFMTDQWIELFQRLSAMLSAADMPPVEVLIVGDHAPPLWHRRARDLFESGQVSWYRLAPK